MIFLLNFTQFDAIIANFETHFAYFETKIPDRFGRGYSHLQAHTRRGSQCSQDCRLCKIHQNSEPHKFFPLFFLYFPLI